MNMHMLSTDFSFSRAPQITITHKKVGKLKAHITAEIKAKLRNVDGP